MQLPSSASLARVIKKFTIMNHPSHTGLFSYSSTSTYWLAFISKLRSSYEVSTVDQGLKSSPITRKYTYFRANRVQIRKSLWARLWVSLEPRLSVPDFVSQLYPERKAWVRGCLWVILVTAEFRSQTVWNETTLVAALIS